MDIKIDFGQYEKVTNTKVDLASIEKSVYFIMNSGLAYEFRTTVLPKFHDLATIDSLAKSIKGARIYYLQRFSNKKTLDPAFYFEPSFKDAELEKMKEIAEKYVTKCEIRS
jgi:pyruvate formate lyase activating enzyme